MTPIEINAKAVHHNMGYCLTGIEAFLEDYGLDVTRTYHPEARGRYP